MSQFPNMNQPAGQPNPFAGGQSPYQQQPKSSLLWLWILLGVGGVGLLVCCGCGGLGMLGVSMAGSQMAARLNADPVVQEHLGTVTSATMDVMGTGEESQRAGGRNVIVFDVVGDKGTGKVIADQAPAPEQFKNARLRLPSGEEFQLGF